MGNDEYFMTLALEQAMECLADREVPVGAVVVRDNQVIAAGRNTRESAGTALGHAEINAIAAACKAVGSWRLSGCTLYVTLEPCPMCAGAIINARLDRVVFGADDPKSGAVGSVAHLFDMPFNHRPAVSKGVMGERCGEILRGFFRSLRQE